MTKLVNRAKMTTATTGTGTITLGSAVDGYQTFAAAGVVNSDVVRYVIEDGDAWEIGLGNYSSGTLTRGSIESSNADAALNLTGNAVVYVSAAAADLQELVDFADNFVLPTADGSTGQVLTTNGAGTLTFSTITGYTDADVDTHLNTGTAASGEVLSWNGTDYDWVTSGGAFSVVGTNNLAAIATLPSLTTGTNNFAAGSNAGANISSTSHHILIGENAGKGIVTGDGNIAIGQTSMDIGPTNFASDNVVIGRQAGRSITHGDQNVFVGRDAGQFSTFASRSVGVGPSALHGDFTSKLTGPDNVGIGYRTGFNLSTGTQNFLGGYQAGTNLTTGSNNVAIGNGALDNSTVVADTIAIGRESFGGTVGAYSGSDGIAIGYLAAGYATSGSFNIAIGREALRGNAVSALTGSLNLGIGRLAGDEISTGNFNTLVGHGAGGAGTTFSQNTHIGYQAGDLTTTGINQIVIGYNSDPSSATVNNEITLGNSSITTLRCQVTTITSLSDVRDKTDIQPLNAGLEFIEALNPVSFTWDMRDGGKVGEADTGFIAQDLQSAQADTGVSIPGLVYDVNPDKLEAGYGKLIPVLVQAIKDLSDKVKYLEAKLEGK